ncbi:hypothetical protein [Haloarcula litorea]|uniref:hypothetical protein n=1 Tax=Haloarcula litorea TaxID=3032579 RepID=UPI0023E76CCC|nr:hypothetical protein [Halomicroarcula sp. GDY20]
MVNAAKWIGLAGTVSALVLVFLSGIFTVPYEVALMNLLAGEIGAIALAHSTYRVSSGKQASPVGAVLGALSGPVMILTTLYYFPQDPTLTITLLLGVLATLGGIAVGVDRIRGGEEGRQSGAQRIANSAAE